MSRVGVSLNGSSDTDSYLLGEATLPKNSMLYQEYEVLNELNNVRLSVRSGNRWETVVVNDLVEKKRRC